MIGQLKRCRYLDDSICVVIDTESRFIGETGHDMKFYKIYKVYDFYSEEYYWVDECDLEKL